jgi:hypothetical protein
MFDVRAEMWDSCDVPDSMLDLVQGTVSLRKLRLFAVACCRRVAHLVTDEAVARLLNLAEANADGTAGEAEMRAAVSHLQSLQSLASRRERRVRPDKLREVRASGYALDAIAQTLGLLRRQYDLDPPDDACWIAGYDVPEDARLAARWGAPASQQMEVVSAEAVFQAGLVREIIANPFRPVVFAVPWLTRDAVAIAKDIYGERRFEDMPILADALEEAGCNNATILAHCRQSGQHVRGCWLIDTLTGKA